MPLSGVVEALRAYPDRFIGGWAPDFRDRHARVKLTQAVKMLGIRVYGELKLRTRYDHPDAIAMFRHCATLGLPVLFHLECPEHTLAEESAGPANWPFWYGGDIGVVDTICRLCPDTAFIGHAPGFWRELSGDAAEDPERYPTGPITPGGRLFDLMRRHPNLHCDLSAGSALTALGRDREVTRAFILEFQDRIMHGRDYFDGRQIELLDGLDLGDDVLDKVLWRNAEFAIRRTVMNGESGVMS
jgi:predicted TIM-barrel fold metal-dependent hydrolase